MSRVAIKRTFFGLAWLLVVPAAAVELAARYVSGKDVFFQAQAQLLSLIPGRPGWLLRNAYYKLTLRGCASNCCFEFGSIMAHSNAVVDEAVYVGIHSSLGRVAVGRNTKIADFVQVLSGGHQHRTSSCLPHQHEETVLTTVFIGQNCWIGAHAVIMADIGDNSVVGAGSVVTKAFTANSVAVVILRE